MCSRSYFPTNGSKIGRLSSVSCVRTRTHRMPITLYFQISNRLPVKFSTSSMSLDSSTGNTQLNFILGNFNHKNRWTSLGNCDGQLDVEKLFCQCHCEAVFPMKQSPPWKEGDRFAKMRRLAMTRVQYSSDSQNITRKSSNIGGSLGMFVVTGR
jgi:hypothetical protein